MEEKKGHGKGKISSSRRSEETVFQSRRKKRRDEYDDDGESSSSSWKTRDDVSSWKRIGRESKRRRKNEVTDIILNHDVLQEVMLRLPVKSLIRFQTVSKHWRLTITSEFFRERYMSYQKTQEPKFLCVYEDESWYKQNIALQTMRLQWYSSRLVEEEETYHTSDDPEFALVDEHDFGVVSRSVDGLFCFYASMELTRQIKVTNPATRWSYKLPLASIQIDCYFDGNDTEFPLPGFGKDCVTGTYKIVWLHNIYYNKNLSCEVFDLRVKQWRQVIPPPDHRLKNYQAPIFANGWLYWFSQEKSKLIAFDLHLEIFRVIPNPIIEDSSSVGTQMGSLDDDRGLVWISETNGDGMQHVWRLTNHNTEGTLLKMDKMFSIDMNKITSTWFDDPLRYSPLFILEAISKNGNKVMLSKVNDNLVMYQPRDSTHGVFSYSPLRPCDSAFVPFFPSLVCPL